MSEDFAEYELPEVDIMPLGRALGQLEQGIAAWAIKADDSLIRDGVIQRFEFTYELCLRKLRRYLNSIAAWEEDWTSKELIRKGVDLGLVHDVLIWADFRKARTDTVHTDNEFRAREVAETAKDFAVEARFLFDNLSRRLAQ